MSKSEKAMKIETSFSHFYHCLPFGTSTAFVLVWWKFVLIWLQIWHENLPTWEL